MYSYALTRICGGFLILGVLSLSIGCGPDYKARATVQGKVTFAGKNLTAGTVMFWGKDNMTGSATIDQNGNYIIRDAPLGDVKITVSVPQPPPPRMLGGPALKDGQGSVNPENPGQRIDIMGAVPKNIVSIPDKYANVETSGLTYTVQKGEQTYDINLNP